MYLKKIRYASSIGILTVFWICKNFWGGGYGRRWSVSKKNAFTVFWQNPWAFELPIINKLLWKAFRERKNSSATVHRNTGMNTNEVLFLNIIRQIHKHIHGIPIQQRVFRGEVLLQMPKNIIEIQIFRMHLCTVKFKEHIFMIAHNAMYVWKCKDCFRQTN